MFVPITHDDVPGIVTLMNRAYRGAGAAGWSTQENYLSGDRITEDVLRADLLANPDASLLKWEDPEGGPLLGCVWIEPLNDDVWYPWRPIRRGKTAGSAGRCSWAPNNGCARGG